jgi:hypothetical protein
VAGDAVGYGPSRGILVRHDGAPHHRARRAVREARMLTLKQVLLFVE